MSINRKSSSGHNTRAQRRKMGESTNKTEKVIKRRRVENDTRKEKNDTVDKIDPVERLMSLERYDNEILNTEVDTPVTSIENASENRNVEQISMNFTKILNDSIRSYYSRVSRNPNNLCNENSTFSLLNKQPNRESMGYEAPLQNQEVPFFKNVNFNNDRAQTFDDYFAYDLDSEACSTDEDKGPLTPADEEKDPLTPADSPTSSHSEVTNNQRMCFYYRDNDVLNLSSSCPKTEPQDIFKILNKNSIISGKASEMIGTGNFLIHDFYL